jgi:hypothetical protein
MFPAWMGIGPTGKLQVDSSSETAIHVFPSTNRLATKSLAIASVLLEPPSGDRLFDDPAGKSLRSAALGG